MKKFLKHLFVGLALLTVALQSSAKQKLETDYSNIKGVCYLGWRADETTVRTQLGYAKRIGINSTRIWLWGYDNDPKQFISSLKNYVRIANDMGITVMPILWNGNSLNPAILEESYWKEKGDAYVKATVKALKDMDGLLCWDIMNSEFFNFVYL